MANPKKKWAIRYKEIQNKANEYRELAQVWIAGGTVILLALKLFYRVFLAVITLMKWVRPSPELYPVMILSLPTLEIVGKALAYSAGIDLAYMLLTPGPDEAIEPLILGLASAILFSVSRIDEPRIELALEIGLYVLVLAGLFLMKEYFIKPDKGSIFWERILALRKTKR